MDSPRPDDADPDGGDRRDRRRTRRAALLVGLLLVGVAWLVASAPFDARYAEDDGDSLRALLDGCEVAVLAEFRGGEGVLAAPWASYRVLHALKGPAREGETLRVVGRGRLPYLGNSCTCGMFPSHIYEVHEGERVFLFLDRHLGGWLCTPAAPSGVLAVERLTFWLTWPPDGLEEAFLEDLVDLADVQTLPAGPARDARETAWLLDALRDPLTAGRAADDLVLNWRARPPIYANWNPTPDASDVRGRLTAAEEQVLVDVFADRRHLQGVREDVAWLLADVEDPRVDALLRAELSDRLAVAAFDPDTPEDQKKDPDATFPGSESPEFDVGYSYRLLSVIARRVGTPELQRRLEDYAKARYDEDEVRTARRFLEAWDG